MSCLRKKVDMFGVQPACVHTVYYSNPQLKFYIIC